MAQGDEEELPLRVSSTPGAIVNPKTPKKKERFLSPEWEKSVRAARKVSEEWARQFDEENSKDADTPSQRMRVVSVKIDQFAADHELANTEAEHLNARFEALKRERPEDDEHDEILTEMRKKRRTAVTFSEKCRRLKDERATFVESIGGNSATARQEMLEILLSTPTIKARAKSAREIKVLGKRIWLSSTTSANRVTRNSKAKAKIKGPPSPSFGAQYSRVITCLRMSLLRTSPQRCSQLI